LRRVYPVKWGRLPRIPLLYFPWHQRRKDTYFLGGGYSLGNGRPRGGGPFVKKTPCMEGRREALQPRSDRGRTSTSSMGASRPIEMTSLIRKGRAYIPREKGRGLRLFSGPPSTAMRTRRTLTLRGEGRKHLAEAEGGGVCVEGRLNFFPSN